MTEAGIDAGITRDLYVALGEPLDDGAWTVRVYHRDADDENADTGVRQHHAEEARRRT